jgi:hypothetical protein
MIRKTDFIVSSLRTDDLPYHSHTKCGIVSVFQVSTGLDTSSAIRTKTVNIGRTSSHRDFVIDYDLMNYIQDTVKAAMEEEIQEAVDKELLLMVRGESFNRQIKALIDEELRSLIRQVSLKTSGAGPGRGHKGRSHRKISLSLPESLYQQARELDGFFSAHVAAALEIYLKLQQKQ